ncbi:hypothetical protein GF356_06315 [candidate division GN15 bacterium]|nr:hypothetical protein [candidate division GN15 bacterium]
MKVVTTIDGEFVQPRDARISVYDNALLYAEGLFETFLSIDERVIFMQHHLQRMSAGLKVTGIKLPVNRKTLKEWMVKTTSAHPAHVKKLRMTITGGEVPRWGGNQGNPRVILTATPHEFPQQPFRLNVAEFKIDQDSVFRRIKTISYVIHAAALKQAKRQKLDDAILLNIRDQVAEVTSANIFWVKRGKVFTPPISAGGLDGVTRRELLQKAPKWGVRIAEQNCKMETLLKADEVFISSSLKVVSPVGLIASDPGRAEYETGPITQHLRDRFYKLLRV